jgi:hypothetical protein
MAREITLHIKVDPVVAEALRSLARRRKQSVGELVRYAINTCYQPDLLNLTDFQKQALEAYRGGYVSLGKLAERLGLSALEARRWLSEHDIVQNTRCGQDDVENA